MNQATALVTGASSGIGKEIAIILASKGYDLILVARRPELLQTLKDSIESTHKVKVEVLISDLSLSDAPKSIFDHLNSKNIRPEILVNNAGFGLFGEFSETEWAKEKMMIDLNITALVHLTKLLLPGMISSGKGRILNVASTAAFQPGPLMAIYFATKAY
jgi:uncharacterized protein